MHPSIYPLFIDHDYPIIRHPDQLSVTTQSTAGWVYRVANLLPVYMH